MTFFSLREVNLWVFFYGPFGNLAGCQAGKFSLRFRDIMKSWNATQKLGEATAFGGVPLKAVIASNIYVLYIYNKELQNQ